MATIKTVATIRLHYCYTLQGWAEHSTEMGYWSCAWNWWSKDFYPRLSEQSHSRLVWWGHRIQLRPQQYWPLQVINIVTRAVSIVPCCQDEPRGGSLHPAGMGSHRGAWLRLGRSRGQLIRIRAVFLAADSSSMSKCCLFVVCLFVCDQVEISLLTACCLLTAF